MVQRIQADRTAMRALANKARIPLISTPWSVVSADGADTLMAAYEYLEDAEQAVRYLANRGVPCSVVGPYREGAPTVKGDNYSPANVEWHVVTPALERDERYAFSSFADAMAYAERQTRKAVIQEWHDGMLFSIEHVYRPNGNTRPSMFPVRDVSRTRVKQLSENYRFTKPRTGVGLTPLTPLPSNEHATVTVQMAKETASARKDSRMWDEEVDDSIDYDRGTGVATKPLTPPRTPRPSPSSVWNDACRRFAAVSEKLTSYETDIEAVYFTKPLLRDVTEKATAAFYDAFGEAQILVHDTFDVDRDDADALFRAVTKAERAWDAANANADRKAAQNIVIGGRALSDDQVRELNTAKRALARVLDPASSPAEAAKAWSLVQDTVDTLRLRPSESLDARLVLALPSALRELERT